MNFRTASSVFGLFVLSMANLSADMARDGQSQPKPLGVTSQPTNVITPPVAPKVSECCNYILTADFIYWRTSNDSDAFALSGVGTPAPVQGVPSVIPPKKGSYKLPDFDFEPGFKIGAGLKFAHDGWDLYANYTWLHPETFKKTVKDPTGLLQDVQSDLVLDSPTITKAINRFRQSLNVLDLELGRNFFLSRFMTLRPYFGLKSAWIHQSNMTSYTPTSFSNSVITITDLIEKRKIKSWGMGIRGGISPVWYFIKDFGLYGNLALSGIWTYYKTSAIGIAEGALAAGGTNSIVTTNIVSSSHTITPVVEWGLGLTYATLAREKYTFTFSGGWEEQVWINFAGNGFFGTFSNGNMTLQGLTLKAGVEF